MGEPYAPLPFPMPAWLEEVVKRWGNPPVYIPPTLIDGRRIERTGCVWMIPQNNGYHIDHIERRHYKTSFWSHNNWTGVQRVSLDTLQHPSQQQLQTLVNLIWRPIWPG